MTRKNYVSWLHILEEVREIAGDLEDVSALSPGIDFAHWVAERIRQLGRDMEAPSAPVVKDKEVVG